MPEALPLAQAADLFAHQQRTIVETLANGEAIEVETIIDAILVTSPKSRVSRYNLKTQIANIRAGLAHHETGLTIHTERKFPGGTTYRLGTLGKLA